MRTAISPRQGLRAGAAMDSYFALIGAHQHGIAVRSMNGPSQASAKALV